MTRQFELRGLTAVEKKQVVHDIGLYHEFYYPRAISLLPFLSIKPSTRSHDDTMFVALIATVPGCYAAVFCS